MERIAFAEIDRKKTGKLLQGLRNDNLELRRYVCRELNAGTDACNGEDCEHCLTYNMETSISQAELAWVLGVEASQIANWESGRSLPKIEYLIFYCRLCGIGRIDDLLVLKEPQGGRGKGVL